MPTKTTIPSPIWEKTAGWIGDCIRMGLRTDSPFISPEAKPGIDQLLRKAKKAKNGENIVLTLSRANAIELMNQMDVWGYESHRLPEEYRRTIPIHGPSGVFRTVSAQLEGATPDADRGR